MRQHENHTLAGAFWKRAVCLNFQNIRIVRNRANKATPENPKILLILVQTINMSGFVNSTRPTLLLFLYFLTLRLISHV